MDHCMKPIDVPRPNSYMGDFFQNSVLRRHVQIREHGELEVRQLIIL